MNVVKNELKDFCYNVRIQFLKGQLKAAVLKHRTARDHMDCGASLAAVFNTDVYKLAKRINEIAAELKEIDPGFPKNWIDYPTGS